MAKKTNEEQLVEVQEKIRQYKNQEKQLLQQQKEEERKARTHRLVERGAILEGIMGVTEGVTDDQIRAVLAKAFNSEAGRKALFALREGLAEKPAERGGASAGSGA